jgi:hypothetical protein
VIFLSAHPSLHIHPMCNHHHPFISTVIGDINADKGPHVATQSTVEPSGLVEVSEEEFERAKKAQEARS